MLLNFVKVHTIFLFCIFSTWTKSPLIILYGGHNPISIFLRLPLGTLPGLTLDSGHELACSGESLLCAHNYCNIKQFILCGMDIRVLTALSHIHVSAAYRSRIYENVDTPRSEPYFARETYVPRMCDVPAMFPWRICDVSVFVWNFTFVCTAYQCVCATWIVQFLYFLNTKFPASYHLLRLYRPVCVRPGRNPNCWFSHAQAHKRGRRCHRRNLDNLD